MGETAMLAKVRRLSRARSAQVKCPYCHAALARAEALARCSDCSTRHHQECFAENGQCSVFGCGGSPVRVRARRRPRLLERLLERASTAFAFERASTLFAVVFSLLAYALVGLALAVASCPREGPGHRHFEETYPCWFHPWRGCGEWVRTRPLPVTRLGEDLAQGSRQGFDIQVATLGAGAYYPDVPEEPTYRDVSDGGPPNFEPWWFEPGRVRRLLSRAPSTGAAR